MQTNIDLINFLKEEKRLKSEHIIESFYNIDRKDFVTEENKDYAYIDRPLSIWYSQTISQPSTVAFMIELLEPKIWENILDIWSGSWWTTALLAYILWNKWYVLWLERIDELVEFWNKNIKKYKFNNAKIKKAWKDLWIPWMQFDKILVSASSKEIPHELITQLIIWWILVIPVQNSILKIEKISNDDFSIKEYPNFVFVPLIT